MSDKEPMVWESIVNEPIRQENIVKRYEAIQQTAEKNEARRKQLRVVRMYEKAAVLFVSALVFFACSRLAIAVNNLWAMWATFGIGLATTIAAFYEIGKAAGTKK